LGFDDRLWNRHALVFQEEKMVLRILSLLVLLVFSCPGLSWTAEPSAEEPIATEAVGPAFPGIGALGPRASALADYVAKSEERLLQLAELSTQVETIATLSEQFNKVVAEMKPLGSPEGWYVDRLNHYINRFNQIRQGLGDLQKKLADRQLAAEKIREQAEKDRVFWAAWEQELISQDVKLPKQTIEQVNILLMQLSQRQKKTSEKLLQLQERIGTFDRDILAVNETLVNALGKLRKATFRRNAYSFFSAEFYQQFGKKLFDQSAEGVTAAVKLNPQYLKENGWRSGLLGLLFLVIFWLLRLYRNKLLEADEWLFILQRPVAAAAFLSVAISWIWLPAPPPLLSFLFLVIAVFSATLLTLSLLANSRQRGMLVLAAAVVLVTNALRLVSLPQPLFRIYITLLAIILIPLLVLKITQSKRTCQKGEGRSFRAFSRLAIIVLAVSLIGQIAGFMNFSTWLIQATIESGIIILFAKMSVTLVSGGIDLGNTLLVQSDQSFFRDYGEELVVRLKRLLKFLIYGFSLFYLLPVWRLFSTVNEGWEYFAELSFEIGTLSLSLQMLGSALIAFYLALQISWALQGMSETQVFARRDVDRGVRDAVKKLIHYAIVLIGFLLALSMLGMGLQNFVVLLGAFGVGIGFGLQDIVNNFLSGLILLFERPIKVGDGVVIDGEYGTVQRIGMRSTVVQNLDEAELIVPNSQMISQKVTNWTLTNRRVRVVAPVGVAYGSDLEKVLAVLTEAGEQHPEVLKIPKPSPLFVQFGASSLDFELRVWISNVDNRPRIKNELLLYIDRRFREEKIEIPFSQHDLHIRSVSAGVFPVGTQDP
jgi:small-conductance mechanosensitive channel